METFSVELEILSSNGPKTLATQGLVSKEVGEQIQKLLQHHGLDAVLRKIEWKPGRPDDGL